MTTRLRPRKRDYQYLILAYSFLPFLVWTGAIWVGWSFWNKPFGLISAVGIFWLGAQFKSIEYRLAYRGLGLPPKGTPGVDVLAFYAEPPETRNKLKVVADDAGLLFAENGAYRMVTIRHDYRIPFDRLIVDPWMKGEKINGLQFRFVPEGQCDEVTFVVSPIYHGDDLKLAASTAAKAEWGIVAISSIRNGARMPQALVTTES